jgi:hypothetical protein
VRGAGYGELSLEQVNSRNGYRDQEFDTRAGAVELQIPKLRHGSYFPDWLLQTAPSNKLESEGITRRPQPPRRTPHLRTWPTTVRESTAH